MGSAIVADHRLHVLRLSVWTLVTAVPLVVVGNEGIRSAILPPSRPLAALAVPEGGAAFLALAGMDHRP